jgi:hypothetical protein
MRNAAMTTSGLLKYAAVTALALSTGCAGSSAIAPSAPAVQAPSAGYILPNLHVPHRYQSILPDDAALAKSTYYDYIINEYGSYATIFNYPTGTKQIGSIKGAGGQGCTNVLYGYGKKTFWNIAGADEITEYSAPQKVLKKLAITGGSLPSSCALDTNGDLAIGILFGTEAGAIALFKKASGTPTFIKTPLNTEYFDGYDPKGNLFFDGTAPNTPFQLDEIPAGSTKVQTIETSNTVSFPGSVQWDGTYVTVEDQEANAIYRYSISGTTATLKSTVTLKGASDCSQTWIAKGVVFCADAGNDGGEVFKYPAGGPPVAILKGNFDEPLGTVAVEK